MAYLATFIAEAWIGDYATPTGNEWDWNATAFIEADPKLKAKVETGLAEDDRWLDDDDQLNYDPNLPDGAKGHAGPFTIVVRHGGVA